MSKFNNPYPTGPGTLPRTFHMRKNAAATRVRRIRKAAQENIRAYVKLAQSGQLGRPVVAAPQVVETVEDRSGEDLYSAVREITRDQQRAMAKRHGLTGYGKMNKAELADLLYNHLTESSCVAGVDHRELVSA